MHGHTGHPDQGKGSLNWPTMNCLKGFETKIAKEILLGCPGTMGHLQNQSLHPLGEVHSMHMSKVEATYLRVWMPNSLTLFGALVIH